MSTHSRTIKGALAVAFAASLLTACTGGGVGAPVGQDGGPVTLKYAFFAPATSFPSVQMEEWKKQIEEKTNGKVKVDLFVGGTLLGAGDIYDGVSQGVVDVGLDSPAYDTGRFPVSSAINLPVGFTESTTASKAFLTLLEEEDPKEFENYEIITAFTTEPAYIQSKEEVTGKAQLAGMQLRTSGAQLPVLQQMGAAPVAMPMSGVAEALQTGVINGYVSSREVMKDFGLADQVKYVTNYPVGVSNSFVAVMDKTRYEALPEDVKQVIQELKPEMSAFASELHDGKNVGDALTFAEEKGVQTVEVAAADKAEWDKVLQGQVDQWVGSHSSADFDARKLADRLSELAKG